MRLKGKTEEVNQGDSFFKPGSDNSFFDRLCIFISTQIRIERVKRDEKGKGKLEQD